MSQVMRFMTIKAGFKSHTNYFLMKIQKICQFMSKIQVIHKSKVRWLSWEEGQDHQTVWENDMIMIILWQEIIIFIDKTCILSHKQILSNPFLVSLPLVIHSKGDSTNFNHTPCSEALLLLVWNYPIPSRILSCLWFLALHHEDHQNRDEQDIIQQYIFYQDWM